MGRDPELASLRALVDRCADRHGGLAFVEGDAGLGKTRLADETVRLARAAGITVLRATADRFAADRPFGVLRDALASLPADATPPSEDDAALVDTARREVGVRGAGGESDAEPGTDRSWHVVQDAVVDAVAVLATEPLLLVVDDAQWADAPSILTLASLLPIAREQALAVVVLFRPSPRGPELAHLLHRANEHDGPVHDLVLAPLDDASVAALVAESRVDADAGSGAGSAGSRPGSTDEPASPSPSDLAKVGGNPYLAVTLARTGRSTLLAKLALDDPATLALLSVVALLGAGAQRATCHAVLDGEHGALEVTIAECVAAGVLVPDGEGLRFQHELVREAVEEHIDSAREIELHRRLATALTAEGAPVTTVARHLAASARAGDVDAAAVLRRAGNELRSGEPAAGAALLEQAVALLPRGHPDHGPTALDAAHALLWSGRLADCRDMVDVGLESAVDDPDLRGRFHVVMAETFQLGGNRIAAVPHLEAALATHPEPSPWRAEVLAKLASTRLWSIDVANAVRDADATIELARQVGAPGPEISAWLVRSRAASLVGDTAEAMSLGNLALTLAGDRTDLATVRRVPNVYVGLGALNHDDKDRAITLFQRGARTCAEAGLPTEEGQHQSSLALAAWMTGEWDLARAAIAAYRATARDTGSHASLATVGAVEGWIAFLTGDRAAADECHRQASADVAVPGADGTGLPYLLWLEARLAETDGDAAKALASLGVVWDLAHAVVPGAVTWFSGDLMRFALAAGDHDRATAVTDLAEVLADRTGTATARGLGRLCRAMLDDDVSAAVDAVELLAASPRPATRIDATIDAAAVLARASSDSGADTGSRRARATSLLTDAVEQARALGAVALVDRATATAAAHGLTLSPARVGSRSSARADATADPWSRVTPAERDVALLVAEGLSNPKIGERLYISRRTVESHVSSLLRKLTLTNRVELARAVADTMGA